MLYRVAVDGIRKGGVFEECGWRKKMQFPSTDSASCAQRSVGVVPRQCNVSYTPK